LWRSVIVWLLTKPFPRNGYNYPPRYSFAMLRRSLETLSNPCPLFGIHPGRGQLLSSVTSRSLI
ncbi:MAG TPA: hypothetical protein VK775_05850, partial [Chthoniobacterales bacterium]|nr:hypothetical protein [Chthoniobacterales bacterium]